MDSNPYSQAYRLFQAALARPPAEQVAYLAAHASDPEIAAIAAKMLRDYDAHTGDEWKPVVDSPEWLRDRTGTVVDEWLIGEHLGLGGFGRVYRATRQAGRGCEEAAVKFLDMSPGQTHRFLEERQHLAGLDHGGICRFLGGGASRGNVPYMAMEYIPGLPIDEYCIAKKLTLRKRLQLFSKLCDAIQYAHSHHVLHLDLKPANILVQENGAVRVLDFGVARLLDTPTRGPGQTADRGPEFWTPGYASPEQLNGAAVGTASDVYSLGVILYRLLTGVLPDSEEALRNGDWKRAFAAWETLAPSQAVASESRRLRRELKGDLDAIVLKSLRKNENERYRRVEILRLEIDSWLHGLPVTARRSRWWERAGKWTRSHPVNALVISLSLLAAGYQGERMLTSELEATAAMYFQQDSMARLQYMAEVALPRIEQALPRDRGAAGLRFTAAGVHTRLLQKAETLPDYVLQQIDSSLISSAIDCAAEWQALGEWEAALQTTDPVLTRLDNRYRLDRRDRPWRDLYLRLLHQRIELHSLVGQPAQALAESRRLADIEGRRP
jgi:hypothetical protein